MKRLAKLLAAKEITEMIEFAPISAVPVTLEDLQALDQAIADAEGCWTSAEMADYEEWLYRMDMMANGGSDYLPN